MKNFFIALIISMLSLQLAHASDVISPYKVVESTGEKLFSRISTHQNELKKFPDLMRDIVDEELMPVVDYRYAAYKILGVNLRKISTEQRNKFVESMRSYLIRTYATALNQYKGQQVNYEPEKSTGSKKIVPVNAKITEPNTPEISIVFLMRHDTKAQQWKAFDLIVEGISLLSSKQAELNGRISKYGIDQVTLELASIVK
ncbi:MlaC/ttg2D family ABC transporter substrate-binding protein [Thalassotalea piscium]|uniref:Phospholipid transport system substrate-binding protein n=1 Tax=Thalassotalea piscium TaxID=1230533 RepID=A0A7X0NK81_9GAMM|nr:ABC transporter substrate-binding protein [Thalassotalea piscium]MBB6544954.1 phospholipid transport system substrate-binding protein [Thalassotalea piscium]